MDGAGVVDGAGGAAGDPEVSMSRGPVVLPPVLAAPVLPPGVLLLAAAAVLG